MWLIQVVGTQSNQKQHAENHVMPKDMSGKTEQ